jgi:hypothetical protein
VFGPDADAIDGTVDSEQIASKAMTNSLSSDNGEIGEVNRFIPHFLL